MMHEEVFRFACSLGDSRAVLNMVFETIYKCFDHKQIGLSVGDAIRCMQSLCEDANPLVSFYVDYISCKKLSVLTLCSMNIEMTRNDIKPLSDAAHKGCLGNLKYFNLSSNTLTDLIENLVSGEDQHGFRSLEILDVSNTGLSTADVKSLFIALHEGNFPKLKELRFLPAPLTDCLSHILRAADHPAFPFSQQMMLQRSYLSKGDVMSIHKALCNGKLKNLRGIDLSHNILTNCILWDADCPVFTSLEIFNLTKTQLGPS